MTRVAHNRSEMDQAVSCAAPAGESEVWVPRARVRRRGRLALAATAAVLASATSPSARAFSPTAATATLPSSSPLACYAARQTPDDGRGGGGSGGGGTPRNNRRPAAPPRSLHVLNVSFLEAPPTTAASFDSVPAARKNGKRVPQHGVRSRVRKGPGPATEGRRATIEIELQPDYGFLELDGDFATAPSASQPSGGRGGSSVGYSNGKHDTREEGYGSNLDLGRAGLGAPEIDSEILYEGITSAPPKPAADSASETTVTAASVEGEPSAAAAASDQPKKKRKSKSSTMPGFIKDDDLDLHIANLGLRRLPTSQRKLTRMVRSKSAKLKRRQTNSEMMYKKSASVPDSLLDYAHEIHAISRVTPKEEKELGTKTQEAMRLQRLHDDLTARYGRDPTDDEWCAAAGKVNVLALREAIEDGLEAKNRLVASNLRMVQRVVNLYIRNGLGSEYNAGDLMQDGTMVRPRRRCSY